MAANGRVYVSRHVVFDESNFPYAKQRDGSSSTLPPVLSTVSNSIPVVDGASRVCMGETHVRESLHELTMHRLSSQPIRSDPVQVVGQAGSNNRVFQAEGVLADSGSSAIPPASRLESPGYSSSREHCSGGVLENVSPAQEVTSHGSVDCSFGHEIPAPVSNEGVSDNLECANEGVVPQLRIGGHPMVTS
ncbi:hypothetical protein V6N12_032396 [Hibiscus sabdariffa]|uniref:Uncharacterized protein n=1 Tax=Hibiscus sabdariffa TaxID=183260 RepID=A0ABR2CCG7_9ROSI